MSATKRQCRKMIYRDWHESQCQRTALEGSEYCASHDPARVEKRRAETRKRWDDKRKASDERYMRERAGQLALRTYEAHRADGCKCAVCLVIADALK